MKTRRSAAGIKAALLLFSQTLFILSGAAPAQAACPAGAQFTLAPAVSENANLPKRYLVQYEKGPMKVKMSLSSPKGALGLAPSADHSQSRFLHPLNRPIWTLSVDKGSMLSVGDLVVSYSAAGSSGLRGTMFSELNPASMLNVTIIPRQITRSLEGDRIVFQGYVDLEIDFEEAMVSGGYSGAITASVDCR